MTINRITDQSGPATLTLHYTTIESAASSKPAISSTTQASSSTAPVAASTPIAPTERTEIINMKNKSETEIWEQLLSVTKTKEVKPTEEEELQIRDLARQKLESDEDSKRSARLNAVKRRAAAVLAAARGGVRLE